ncbi:hypothetical protein EYF80_065897 [Liparis tanakae]|uniref:Uncharacterized protein n=1 Tax=Liparis tanakae TaxID=230148 RepID=A0A4Z2E5V8_9TELE|nr:hypothetical protein EYF80_065897 [Liparis tanakae]
MVSSHHVIIRFIEAHSFNLPPWAPGPRLIVHPGARAHCGAGARAAGAGAEEGNNHMKEP